MTEAPPNRDAPRRPVDQEVADLDPLARGRRDPPQDGADPGQ